ncbi:FAD-dependent oxidoreductase [Actinomadura sp. NTSP31]|uniref:FAD-dependent oxidoreductase n=1 Tax=Actinomadura sp. NTSP31 TaxID=1735447 RepID=UPI0035BF8EAB
MTRISTTTTTIIGGGIAGLTAAIACAERGADVVLHEAHATLGGRARSTASPYIANDGTHAFYSDGAPWRWLAARGLAGPAARLLPQHLAGLRFRHSGRVRVLPPVSFVRMLTLGRRPLAPADQDFRTWATHRFGTEAFEAAAGVLGPATYTADPGALSAEFAHQRLLRVARAGYPATRYPRGGWGAVVDRMVRHARGLGVRIHTSSRVTELPEDGPVIIATTLAAARGLLNDDALAWHSGHAVLLDIAVRPARTDRFLLFDLDEGGFLERVSGIDPSMGPRGEALIQAAMPVRPGESKTGALRRLEDLFDLALPGWPDRLTWRRDQAALHRTGALDLPGRSWRDRPAIDRGDGRYLAGDMTAAPGFLAEVSITSALKAAHLATTRGRPGPSR